MVGFLTLSPEEIDIVTRGGLEDPRYRPFPGSRNAQLEELLELEEAYGVDDRDAQARRLAMSDRFYLDRIAAGKYWQSDSAGILLLVDLPRYRLQDGPIAGNVIGLAYARAGSRGIQPGTRRLSIGPCVLVPTPFSVLDLLADLTEPQARVAMEAISGQIRLLPKSINERVSARLQMLVAEYEQIADALRSAGQAVRRGRTPRDLQRRDAVATALNCFGRRWRSAEPVAEPSASEFAEDVAAKITATENDYVTDDAAVFPEWSRSARSVRGWWEFTRPGRRLLIKNINVSTAEAQTGADLVYVRRAPDSVVLVQYKMLEQVGASRSLVYRPDGRLTGQIDRMTSFEHPSDSDPYGATLTEYRLGPGFTFVKFLANEEQVGLADDELTRGYYVPSEMMRVLLQNPDTGPRGGSVYYVTQHRYIDSRTFVKLVQDGWIGSTGSSTIVLERLAGLPTEGPAGDVTIAVDEPISSGM